MGRQIITCIMDGLFKAQFCGLLFLGNLASYALERLTVRIPADSVCQSCFSPSAKSCVCVGAQSLSHGRFFASPWTVAHQAPLSMGFSRQEYWSRLPCPPPGDLPNPSMNPYPALAGGFFTIEPLGKPMQNHRWVLMFQGIR